MVVQWLRLCLLNAGDEGSILDLGVKIPHASQAENQTIKQKQHCNKFSKDFKNGPRQNIIKREREQVKESASGILFR